MGALHDDAALVVAESGVELAVADVHGVDAGAAALQHAVGEAAGGGAGVEDDEAGDVDPRGG